MPRDSLLAALDGQLRELYAVAGPDAMPHVLRCGGRARDALLAEIGLGPGPDFPPRVIKLEAADARGDRGADR
jgi:hypothetical protein